MDLPKVNFSSITRFSKTHSYSMLFFPAAKREDVKRLYLFCREVDNSVDEPETSGSTLAEIREDLFSAMAADSTPSLEVNKYMSDLHQRYQFQESWISAMFTAMEMDLQGKRYTTIAELEEYMYGVAGVVGLMLARILELDEASFSHAVSLGYAGQYANMIRDIGADLKLGRQYLPQEDLDEFGLKDLSREVTTDNPREFSRFLEKQRSRFEGYLAHAEEGYKYIPNRYLSPIMTIADMYTWTVEKVINEPQVVYQKIVKPQTTRVLVSALRNYVRLGQK